jgi:hypothetical protein
VWHHRRATVRAYLRQQRGYGLAEALLERKEPGRFNRLGHVSWPGQLYGSGARPGPLTVTSVYGGTWGSAPYQSIYERTSHWAATPLMPEWWLMIAGLLLVGLLGWSWPPLWVAGALALAMTAASAVVAMAIAADQLGRSHRDNADRLRRFIVLTTLVLGQSLARLRGRLAGGLVPWRRHRASGWLLPRAHRLEGWSEDWHALEVRLRAVEGRLDQVGVAVSRGGAIERWDLEARVGGFATARLLGAVEEHGHGRQMVRWLAWPRPWIGSLIAVAGALALSTLAALDGGLLAAGVLAVIAGFVGFRTILDMGQGVGVLVDATGLERGDR